MFSAVRNLPPPVSVSNQSKRGSTDDIEQHEGRIRSFEHERGNWASYISVTGSAHLLFYSV